MDTVLEQRKQLLLNDIKYHDEQMVKYEGQYTYYFNRNRNLKYLKKLQDNIKFQQEVRNEFVKQYELEFGKFEL